MSTAVHALDAPTTHRRRNVRQGEDAHEDIVEGTDAFVGKEGEDDDELPPPSIADDCITCGIVSVVLVVIFALFWFVFMHMVAPSEVLSQRLANAPKVEDQHLHAHVDLAQLYNGHILHVDVQRQLVCRQCAGTGVDVREGFHECHTCHGAGVRTHVQQIGAIKQHVRTACNVCQGRGKVANKKCDVCHGHGLLRDKKTMDVRVARGMRDGDQVTLAHEGSQARGMLPGNVVVHLHMHPHALFTRRGDDLEMELHISLLEALVGFTRNVTHLDDRVLSLHRAEIVSPSTLWRLRGQGMPVRNATGTFGDLLVRFVVEYPTALTADEKQRVHSLLP